jgi:hypothetical protein
MKNADWLDVAACIEQVLSLRPKNENHESASAAPYYTLRSFYSDRRGFSRLSKIAHKDQFGSRDPEKNQRAETPARMLAFFPGRRLSATADRRGTGTVGTSNSRAQSKQTL